MPYPFKRFLYSFLLVVLLAPTIHGLEMSLSRFSYNLTEHFPTDVPQVLNLVMSVSSKEDIQDASVSIGIRPFVFLDAYSLDSNFQASYEKEGGTLHLQIHRVGNDSDSSEEWVNVELSVGREGETYYSDFGEFPLLAAEGIDRSGVSLSTLQLRSGGWTYHSDFFPALPVRVLDRNRLPVSNVLVVYELIGRAGIAMGRLADERGLVEFIHSPENFFPDSVYPPLEEIQPTYDCVRFIDQSSFVGEYIRHDSFTARFIVFPTQENDGFSEPYLFDRTLCFSSGEGLNFAEETLVLGDSMSGLECWCLYP